MVENAFGIMASRFRVFRQPILQSYDNAVKTVQACVVLHNFLISVNERSIEPDDDLPTVTQSMIPLQAQAGNRTGTNVARTQRDNLARYFFEEGAVDFQWQQTFHTN